MSRFHISFQNSSLRTHGQVFKTHSNFCIHDRTLLIFNFSSKMLLLYNQVLFVSYHASVNFTELVSKRYAVATHLQLYEFCFRKYKKLIVYFPWLTYPTTGSDMSD